VGRATTRIAASEQPTAEAVLPFVLPLTKLDLATGIFTACAALEVADTAGEVFDYATSKPHFEALAQRALAESGGKKVAPLRVMHQLREGGLVTEFHFDDAAHVVGVTGRITDPDVLSKAQDGTLCGVSMGGKKRYLATIDPMGRRYTAMPQEISLVDLGAIPGTGITMLNAAAPCEVVAADGQVASHALIPSVTLGEATHALGTAGDVRRAWHALRKATDAPGYAAQREVIRAWRAFPAALEKASTWGFENIARLTELLASLQYLLDATCAEAAQECDGSPVPAGLANAIAILGNVLAAMTLEEVDELTAETDAVIGETLANAAALAVGDATLAKADALRGMRKRVQLMHDLSADMGAACASAEADFEKTTSPSTPRMVAEAGQEDGMTEQELTKAVRGALGLTDDEATLEKAIGAIVETKLEKATSLIESTATKVTSIEERLAAAEATLEKVAATPLPGRGVTMQPDDGGKSRERDDAPAIDMAKATPIEVIQHIHRQGAQRVSLGARA
jgi:hypothetical protein